MNNIFIFIDNAISKIDDFIKQDLRQSKTQKYYSLYAVDKIVIIIEPFLRCILKRSQVMGTAF